MIKFLTFNVNSKVLVRLTDRGRELHRRSYQDTIARIPAGLAADNPYKPPKENAEGWTDFQLWELMELFGPHIFLGCEQPFESNIRLLVENEPIRIMAEYTDTLPSLQAILSDQLGIDLNEVKPEAKLAEDLGADSLDQVEITWELEDTFEIDIPDSVAEKMLDATVANLVEYIDTQRKA